MRICSKLMAVAVVVAGLVAWPGTPDAAAEAHYLMASAAYDAYFREAKDQEWHLFFEGEVPVYSWAGAAIVVHDAAGQIVHRAVIPRGTYSEEKPYIITIQPDGITGDYRVVMVGHQIQYLGALGMVWSDLPYEVYGGARVSVPRGPASKPWFKAPEGVSRMKLGAAKGNLRVLDGDGKVIADTRTAPAKEKDDAVVEFSVVPGQAYRLDLEGASVAAYAPDRIFLSYQPERWFQPSADLAGAKFWKGARP